MTKRGWMPTRPLYLRLNFMNYSSRYKFILLYLLVFLLSGCGNPAATITEASPTSVVSPSPVKTSTLEPTPTSIPSEPTLEASPTLAGETPTTQAPAINQILDLTFVDALHGWLIGSQCDNQGNCTLAVRSSQDGGKTWRSEPAPCTGIAWNGESAPSHDVRNIRFANLKEGWAFEPGLFATQDGGKTWTDETRAQPVIALQPVQDSVWAIQGSCRSENQCNFSLIQWNPAKNNWQPLNLQPQILRSQVQLVRHKGQDAWVLSWGSGSPPSKPANILAITHDGGENWIKGSSPCTEAGLFTNRLAAVDSHQVWTVCAGEPGAGQQMKYLFKSSDGGESWGEGIEIGSGGYLDDLAAITSDTGFLGVGRGTLMATQDGGQSWSPAIPISKANPTDTSGWRIVFVDTQNGWASLGRLVFRTTDGGKTWEISSVS